MPGVEALLEELLGHRVPVAVATSSVTALYTAKTARHAWFERFTAIVCGDDPRVRAVKPAPDIFLAAAESVGVEPAECVVVEDSPAGIRAGIAAGMRVVAAPDPNVSDEHVAHAHHIVRDARALRSVLLEWLAL
jgi:pseudouridine-5'-monophosphatase